MACLALSFTRRDALCAGATAVLAPPPAAAQLLQPALTWRAQQQLVRSHATRFASSRPAAVQTLSYSGHTMRQLVATASVPASTRVAVYPVEVVSDDADEFDDTYAVGLYRERRLDNGQSQREMVGGLSGIPTSQSLASAYVEGLPTNAMFANEPDETHQPNCRFVFPTIGAAARPGDIYVGVLETVISVRRGTPLTWCYGPPSVERGYATACSASSGNT